MSYKRLLEQHDAFKKIKEYHHSYAQLLQLTYICANHPHPLQGKCLFDPHCVSHSYRTLGHADIKVSGPLNYYIVILVCLGVSQGDFSDGLCQYTAFR